MNGYPSFYPRIVLVAPRPQYSSQAVSHSWVLMKIHHGELIVSSLWPSWWASHEHVWFVQLRWLYVYSVMKMLIFDSNQIQCLIDFDFFFQKVLVILFSNDVHHECHILYKSGSLQWVSHQHSGCWWPGAISTRESVATVLSAPQCVSSCL